jgi:hypothetical protein
MTNKIVQISCLGNHGRFGNQLFQYCFAKAYAERHGAILQIPQGWVGEEIFEIREQYIDRTLPQMPLDYIPDGQCNIDLFGYFQNQDSLNFYSKTKAKEWLKFKYEIAFEAQCVASFNPYIALHFRRGDYKQLINVLCIPTKKSYYEAVQKYFPNTEINIFDVSDDLISPPSQLPKHLAFLVDFFILMNSTILFRANSSFSWWAAELGNMDKVYSPIVRGKLGYQDCEFVEGNHPVMVSHPGPNQTDLYLRD